MRRLCGLAGALALAAAWATAATGAGFAVHMAAHMTVVALQSVVLRMKPRKSG